MDIILPRMCTSLGHVYFKVLKEVCRHCHDLPFKNPYRRRVVITGIGLVTPLGVGVEKTWKSLLSGETRISRLEGDGYAKIPCKVAASIRRGADPGSLDLTQHFKNTELKNMSEATALAVIAADEALKDAKWSPETLEERKRTGVAVGMGMLPLEDVVDTGMALRKGNYSRVSPFFVPRILTNLAAGQVSIKYGLLGPNHAVSTACATGAHAIGDACRLIRNGDASVMVCGGTEACIGPLSVAAFSRMRALCTKFNDCPSKASRPFDAERDGFVMGEGSGIVVLEEYDHAKDRGANMYAEILGYGLSGDGYHVTAPREDGLGAQLSMQASLRDAGVEPNMVGYINAHATSTPLGDAVEVNAIRGLFGNHTRSLAVSSTKGAIGHLLGAAGSVEFIFTALACYEGVVPPTANLECPGAGLDLNFVPHLSQKFPIFHDHYIALTNSFGFGGTNATLCLGSIIQ